jgi:hypothetical protein
MDPHLRTRDNYHRKSIHNRVLIWTRFNEKKTARRARPREERDARLLAGTPILLVGCSHFPACSFFVSSTRRPARSTSGTSETRLRQSSLCHTSLNWKFGDGVCVKAAISVGACLPALTLMSLSHPSFEMDHLLQRRIPCILHASFSPWSLSHRRVTLAIGHAVLSAPSPCAAYMRAQQR